MMGSILGIALSSYSENHKDALALSDALLSSLDHQIAIEVRNFLCPASAPFDSESPGVYWTGIYIFFTVKNPGITASKTLRDDSGELLGVVGQDIELATQGPAFSDLAAKPALFDPLDLSGMQDLTRIVADTSGVRRVSVWQWLGGGLHLD